MRFRFVFSEVTYAIFGTFFVIWPLNVARSHGTSGLDTHELLRSYRRLDVDVVRVERRSPCERTPVAPNSRTFAIHNLELERRTRTNPKSDAALKATIDVTAEAARNEATLSGVIASEAVCDKAIEIAKSAHSGLTIDRMPVTARDSWPDRQE